MSTPSRLGALPDELLQNICEHLETRRKSLYAFSLLNKECCAAADSSIFRRISLAFVHYSEKYPLETPLDLTPQIAEWQAILTR